MKKPDALAALAAMAQDNRLDIFRLLVEAGRDGMAAGAVAEALGVAPNALSFHLDRLRDAGLVTVRRDGRSMIYAARYETMNALIAYLTENCCRGRPEQCLPVTTRQSSRKARKPQRTRTAEPVS
ncbi:MAG: ArsR/SmtB family transcription factor [Xanthobacteraceae bacterium]|jgi:ArsR family transcriptional regulator, arsenate/arsenite/antimonite-responsive transcriptional repressor